MDVEIVETTENSYPREACGSTTWDGKSNTSAQVAYYGCERVLSEDWCACVDTWRIYEENV